METMALFIEMVGSSFGQGYQGTGILNRLFGVVHVMWGWVDACQQLADGQHRQPQKEPQPHEACQLASAQAGARHAAPLPTN